MFVLLETRKHQTNMFLGVFYTREEAEEHKSSPVKDEDGWLIAYYDIVEVKVGVPYKE